MSRSDRQSSIPGTAADIRGLLRQKAAAPIKPRKAQQPLDIGLFSDDAAQLDLVEMFMDSTEED
jgi:hypothetical protein